MTQADFIAAVEAIDVSRFAIPTKLSARLGFYVNDGVDVRCVMQVKDVATGRPTTVNLQVPIDGDAIEKMKPNEVPPLLLDVIEKTVLHEVRECVFFDGRQIVDPHQEAGR